MNKLLIIFLCIFSILINAQTTYSQSTREQIISAYLLNFTDYVIWENEKSITDFKILILTNPNENNSIFKNIEKVGNKKFKSIKVSITNDFDEKLLSEAQMIFVAKDKSEFINDIFEKIEFKPILLVTENFENERLIMINLYETSNSKIAFKINKINMLNQNFSFDEKLLLLGGKEIDIVELYLKSKQSLRNFEKQIENYQTQFKLLNKKIERSENLISEQNKNIENQKLEYSKIENEINKVKTDFEKQNILISEKQKTLFLLNKSLNNSKILLNKQLEEIDSGKKVLENQKIDINKKNKTINKKNEELSSQWQVIIRQRYTVYLFSVIILLIITLVLFMIKNNKIINIKNSLLQSQKEELNSNLEEIKTINEQLNEKNENFELTLNELKNAQRQIAQAEKMASLGVLTAGIAHEINNPINFIYTGINSLKKDFEDIYMIINELNNIELKDKNIFEKIEKINKLKKEYFFKDAIEAIPQIIKDITTGVERTTEIIKGLRIFSKEGDKNYQIYSVNKIIDNSLLLLKNKYKNRISIIKNYEQNIYEINCNPGKIIQVFINIINNSIDAIEGDGEITICTKELNNKIHILIKDNGKGMDKETQYKIFDPFFTTKDIGSGTGLGLSISYGIIEEHFGEILVNSELNKGTEFEVIFNAHR